MFVINIEFIIFIKINEFLVIFTNDKRHLFIIFKNCHSI